MELFSGETRRVSTWRWCSPAFPSALVGVLLCCYFRDMFDSLEAKSRNGHPQVHLLQQQGLCHSDSLIPHPFTSFRGCCT